MLSTFLDGQKMQKSIFALSTIWDASDRPTFCKTHSQIFELLRATGIGVNLHYIPVHRQPYYEKLANECGLSGDIANEFEKVSDYYTLIGLSR